MEESIAKEARAALDADPRDGLLQQLVLSCDQLRSSKQMLDSATGRKEAGQGSLAFIANKADFAISNVERVLPEMLRRWQSSRSPGSCLTLISAQLMLATSRETLALVYTAVETSNDLDKPKAVLNTAVNSALSALSDNDCDDSLATTCMLQVVSAHVTIQRMIKSLAHVPEAEPTLKIPRLQIKKCINAARTSTFHDRAGQLRPFDMGNKEVVGGVVELPEGSYFLGLAAMRSNVYITDDYWQVWKMMEARRHVLYIATPGCGKSMGALAILCHLIRRKQTVVYRSKGLLLDNQCFVFQDDAADVLPFNQARALLEMADTWFISDGFDTGACPCHVLLVTSSDSTKVTDFQKQQKISTFVGRLWKEEELMAAGKACHPNVPGDVILYRSRLLGPVPRVVFCEDEETFAAALGFVAEAVETTPLKHIFACLGSNSWKKFSHPILLLDRAPNGSACQRLASKFVAGLVLARTDKYVMDNVRTKMLELRRIKRHAVDVGIMLEGLFHAVYPAKLEKYTHICAADCLQAPHPEAGRISDACTRDTYGDYEHFVSKFLRYRKAKELLAVYFMPLSEQEPTIDSLYVDFKLKVVHLYQLTINQEHGAIKSVVQRWLAFFRTYKFTVTGLFFVTDDVSFHGMKTQAWKIKRMEGKQEQVPEDARQRFGALVDAANQSSPVCQYKVLFNYDFNSAEFNLGVDFKEYIEKVNEFQLELARLGHPSDSRKRLRCLHGIDDEAIEETLSVSDV